MSLVVEKVNIESVVCVFGTKRNRIDFEINENRYPMSTSIRGKDWVFNALWAVSGNAGSEKGSCTLSIPVTFLFKDGQPAKTIMTDIQTGRLEKIHLEDIVIDRFDYSDGFRGASLRSMRALRKLLDDFTMAHGYYKVQELDEPYIAKVFYYIVADYNSTFNPLILVFWIR